MTVHDHAVELGPLADARAQLREAVTVLGYDDGLFEMLAAPRREMTVNIPLRRDDGSVELITGHRVQHNLSRGPAKGGFATIPGRPGRGPRAGDVDDLEVRPAGRAVRRREGRRGHRPARLLPASSSE